MADAGGLDAAVPDAQIDAALVDAGTDAPAVDAGLVRLSIISAAATCGPDTAVFPAPGEEGMYYAVRLTPPAYPFVVTAIEYEIDANPGAGVNCLASLAHSVQVFTATTVAPPTTPTVLEEIDVPADPSIVSDRAVHADLTTPITLDTGEDLFVSLKMTGLTPDILCVKTCVDPDPDFDRNYWSNATMAPFSWARLHTFGLDDDARIEALGRPL